MALTIANVKKISASIAAAVASVEEEFGITIDLGTPSGRGNEKEVVMTIAESEEAPKKTSGKTGGKSGGKKPATTKQQATSEEDRLVELGLIPTLIGKVVTLTSQKTGDKQKAKIVSTTRSARMPLKAILKESGKEVSLPLNVLPKAAFSKAAPKTTGKAGGKTTGKAAAAGGAKAPRRGGKVTPKGKVARRTSASK